MQQNYPAQHNPFPTLLVHFLSFQYLGQLLVGTPPTFSSLLELSLARYALQYMLGIPIVIHSGVKG